MMGTIIVNVNPVPEFSFVVPILLISFVSVIIFYRVKNIEIQFSKP